MCMSNCDVCDQPYLYEDTYCENCMMITGRTLFSNQFVLFLENKTNTNTRPLIKQKVDKRVSPLRYPGGKSAMIDYIALYLNEQRTTLISPFSGGASFELAMLLSGKIQKLHLNDLDRNVYAFWKEVIFNTSCFIKKVEESEVTHANIKHHKAILQHASINDQERAVSFFLANRMSYSGIITAGLQGGEKGSLTKLTDRFNWPVLKERILRIASYRHAITVTNEDAFSLIEETYWNDAATLFIDPPYIDKGDLLYQESFTEADHIALGVLLDTLYSEAEAADLLVTYDNHDFFLQNYVHADIIEINRKYSI